MRKYGMEGFAEFLAGIQENQASRLKRDWTIYKPLPLRNSPLHLKDSGNLKYAIRTPGVREECRGMNNERIEQQKFRRFCISLKIRVEPPGGRNDNRFIDPFKRKLINPVNRMNCIDFKKKIRNWLLYKNSLINPDSTSIELIEPVQLKCCKIEGIWISIISCLPLFAFINRIHSFWIIFCKYKFINCRNNSLWIERPTRVVTFTRIT